MLMFISICKKGVKLPGQVPVPVNPGRLRCGPPVNPASLDVLGADHHGGKVCRVPLPPIKGFL